MTLEELLKMVPANMDLEVEDDGGNSVVKGQAIDIMNQPVLLAKEVASICPVRGDKVFNEISKSIIKLEGDVRS